MLSAAQDLGFRVMGRREKWAAERGETVAEREVEGEGVEGEGEGEDGDDGLYTVLPSCGNTHGNTHIESLLGVLQGDASADALSIQGQGAVITEAKSFLAQETSLDTHLQRVGSYLPVAEGIAFSAISLQDCLGEHPVEQVVSADCSSVLGSMRHLLERFHSQFEALRNLDFDPAESLEYMQNGAKILLRVSAAYIIPLPAGTKTLSLTYKRKCRQAELANGLVRELLDLVGPIIDRQREILSYSKRLTALGTDQTADPQGDEGDISDLDRWGVLDTIGSATVTLLSNLSAAQGKAHALISKLEGLGEEVTPEDIEDEETERDIQTVYLRRRYLSDEEKQAIREKIASMEAKISRMRASVLSRSEVSSKLQPYLLLPEVADILGVPVRERVVDTAREQHPMDWGDGYVVTETGLEEGVQNLVNPYAIVDKTNLDLTSDDFKEQNVTSWDMTGSRVAACDLTGVQGLTVDHISSLSALTQCTLKGMDLTGLDLSGTDATGSDFSMADLRGCTFSSATLTGCVMTSANLTDVSGITQEHVASVSILKGVVLTGVDMRGWDLQKVDLGGADLSQCQMGGAKVTEDLVEGTTLPEGSDAPTVTLKPTAWFVEAPGVTKTVVTRSLVSNVSDSYPSFTMVFAPVDGTRSWTLTAPSRLNLRSHDHTVNYMYQLIGKQQVTCTRSGSNISIVGDSGSHNYPCTPGEEARVELLIHPGSGSTLTLAHV
ncbi:hypothetical protein KIPB_005157 [Kipferlia bialata]|uniref:Pentapeptide repeat-containing protein n=1 Tax=Kipferlia bialata TaxID=797122 RepID=A0A9K3CX34_9EUKA|nr:hypothetical protein KIPB_005157 [Kipferlia bialata]|eukprot:g5157.t1